MKESYIPGSALEENSTTQHRFLKIRPTFVFVFVQHHLFSQPPRISTTAPHELLPRTAGGFIPIIVNSINSLYVVCQPCAVWCRVVVLSSCAE